VTVRAKKRLGQHFLHDPGVIRRLVDAIAPERGDRVVEIGGGPGALTRPLVERLDRLHVVEVDRELAAELPSRVAHPELRVVGNLPYNISTPLLFHLLERGDTLKDLHVMLQREVVDRMTARPGGKEYGRLTVMVSLWAQAVPLFDVGPGAFTPPPKVWSTVVRLVPRAPDFVVADRERFAALVAHLFSMRRKTLGRSLKGRLAPERIAALGIDPRARPETLTAADFARLAAEK
jgi:16S rRNA (adenine1518-N6/adenine1519-N6)-dimethyltransferase